MAFKLSVSGHPAISGFGLKLGYANLLALLSSLHYKVNGGFVQIRITDESFFSVISQDNCVCDFICHGRYYISKGVIRSSWRQSNPTKMAKLRSELPPYENRGSVMPVTGMIPRFIPTFTTN